MAIAMTESANARDELGSEFRGREAVRAAKIATHCSLFTPRPVSIFLPHFPVL
ncbi:MAG: hypothetical protein WCB14_11320 [Candidatus Acidiferrales bacterium]